MENNNIVFVYDDCELGPIPKPQSPIPFIFIKN